MKAAYNFQATRMVIIKTTNMTDHLEEDLSSYENEEILLFLLLVGDVVRCVRAANRQIWIKRWILRRQNQGAYANLFRKLNEEDPEKFKQF